MDNEIYSQICKKYNQFKIGNNKIKKKGIDLNGKKKMNLKNDIGWRRIFYF